MAPTHVSQARARTRGVALAASVLAAAFVAVPGTATAHHEHAGAAPAAAHHAHHATPAAASPAHAHHAASSTSATTGAAKRLAPSASMWQISSPSNPRVAKGPRGPLWRQYTPVRPGYSPMGGTLAASYVARQLEAARDGDGEVATKAALTTSQATKKLTKKCQRLVKITKSKQVAKLKKADRKARTKCLAQRRKIIADSEKKPTTPATAPSPTSPAPNTQGTPAPTNPTPAPATPQNPSPTPNPNPTPNPTPNPAPAECAAPGTGTVVVTAIEEGAKFDVNMCGAKAGAVKFRLDNTDASGDEHDLVIASSFVAGVGAPSGTVAGGTAPTPAGESSREVTVNLTAGTWFLICSVPGHGNMRVEFKVFA